MAKNQNCSETKTCTLATKRKDTIPTLSRILKSQTSSCQHRTSPRIEKKIIGGLRIFFIKALVGCGAIYLTAIMGVWGEAEESTKIVTEIKRAIHQFDRNKIISENMKNDIKEKFKVSKDFVKGHLECLPEEIKVYYDKTEKYVTDFLKSRKP